MNILKSKKYLFIILACLATVTKAIAQDPGGNPDGPPPAVPFDDYYLYVILLLAGVILVFYKFKKSQAIHQ